MNIDDLQKQFNVDGVSFEYFHGFPAVRMSNKYSSALVSVYGGHVVEFNLRGSQPVLWMSEKSKFESGAAIRGGVPVCFPWFGAAPEGKSGSHGFVRNAMWQMIDAGKCADGGNFVTLRYTSDEFRLDYVITASQKLTMSLKITNCSRDVLEFSGALHTYFNVSDISNVSVNDLDDISFIDSVSGSCGIQKGELLIDREIDRIFCTCGSTRIVDRGFGRTIKIDKYGSDSTVVWNPWIDKSRRMPDFGDEEYHTMLCVEAAKVPRAGDSGFIQPGAEYELRQVIRIVPEAD